MKFFIDRHKINTRAQLSNLAMQDLGVPANKFYTSPEIITSGSLEITERYGNDVGIVDYDVYNNESV
jgi:hypothetical protein